MFKNTLNKEAEEESSHPRAVIFCFLVVEVLLEEINFFFLKIKSELISLSSK